ncbi:uncharacterized protein LOC143033595 [Oratosquilla oratoria]|uniref:uncharacterized protein LOC143033595 n=1 Tax=Oratosquilla oratoria TaxID=337810 RepID=UPI003F76B611
MVYGCGGYMLSGFCRLEELFGVCTRDAQAIFGGECLATFSSGEKRNIVFLWQPCSNEAGGCECVSSVSTRAPEPRRLDCTDLGTWESLRSPSRSGFLPTSGLRFRGRSECRVECMEYCGHLQMFFVHKEHCSGQLSRQQHNRVCLPDLLLTGSCTQRTERTPREENTTREEKSFVCQVWHACQGLPIPELQHMLLLKIFACLYV